ncbi:hypothetical protein JYU34_022304 [Plutella xylostella]|uniref:Uncharacterized protein n=1 Tax=Plutella xylostella TaxID=51655 RepID=A0ABQ7PQX4_PLUXY|nr:hypothetical protein JYU34_022304 [Plutella xylostella]
MAFLCGYCGRYHNLTSHWSGYGAGFRKVFRVAPDPDRVDSVNVVFLGFDSTSRNGFLRDMPRTVKVLKDFGAVIMNGYNILGDATPATMFPLLTGHTELELPDRRRGFSGAYVDDFPFVFKRLWGDGYRTAYFEDSPEIGTFQMRFNGFCNPPADHYLRHFFLLANEVDRESAGPYSDQYYCTGDTPTYQLMLDKTEEFMKLEGKKFAFTFIVEMTHDRGMLSTTDQAVADWLARFQRQGHLGNTLLVLHSDHGPRRESLRRTFTGKLEERLPFLAITLPESYKRSHPEALRQLQANQDRLTTPHDLYATYVHVIGLYEYLNLYRIPGSSLLRGMSLLEPIPASRRCAEAGIEVHWCACVRWSNVSRHDPLYHRSGEALVQYINSLTSTGATRSLCATRYLRSIDYVLEQSPDTKLLRFRASLDNDHFIPGFHKENVGHANKTTYSIKIVTGPGEGVYESTMFYIKAEDRFILDYRSISRVNSYNEEPSCVRETYPHLNKFCYCTQYLT